MDLTLVIGGARSGKSAHAEGLVTAWPAPWVYLATAALWDDEMRARAAGHVARRGGGWRTVAAPLEVAGALAAAGGAPVLLDCLTLWLSNLMLGGHDVEAATAGLGAALARRAAPTVLVTNEVGQGIVPENALARRFRDEAGRLNQAMAAQAGRVVLVVAGLPLALKGTL